MIAAARTNELVLATSGDREGAVLAASLGLQRQWLHAVELGFEHPGSGEWVTFTSPYPPDLHHALECVEQA